MTNRDKLKALAGCAASFAIGQAIIAAIWPGSPFIAPLFWQVLGASIALSSVPTIRK